MSSNIVNSLERLPRPGLRSAEGAASLRSLSQGAPSSRLPANSAGYGLRPPAATGTTSIGSPHRPRGARTPTTPAAGSGPEDAQPRRAQLEDENLDLRHRLALADQLAESNRRYADLLATTDNRADNLVRELLLARAERPTEPRLSRLAGDTAGDNTAWDLAIRNLNTLVGNPTLVANLSLGAVITVKRVNDMFAALLKLLGTLRGAAGYEGYARHVLRLPRPGIDAAASAFADSAACGVLDIVFHIVERPPSPDGSVSSGAGPGSPYQRLIAEHANKVACVLAGDVEPGGADSDRLVSDFQRIDGVLYSHLLHLIGAPAGSAVYDAVFDQRTFILAMAGLLRSAGHGADQDRERQYECAFGACPRYGGVADMTPDQLAEVLRYDISRRTKYLRMLDLPELAMRLAIGGLPTVTGGAKATFRTELIQAVMPADSDDAQPDGTRDERL